MIKPALTKEQWEKLELPWDCFFEAQVVEVEGRPCVKIPAHKPLEPYHAHALAAFSLQNVSIS